MYTKEELEKENQAIINQAKEEKTEYFSILSTMAKFHKYTVPQQLGLKRYALPEYTACASQEQWERFKGRMIVEGAVGVPVIEDNPFGRSPVRMIYDISDTVSEEKGIPNVLWKFDEEHHAQLIHGYIAGDGSVPQKIAYLAEELCRNARAVKPIDRIFLGHTLAVILMERLGYDTTAYRAKAFPEANFLRHDVEKVLIEANQMSKRILKIVEDYVKEERKINHERTEESGNPLHRALGRIYGIVHADGKTERVYGKDRRRDADSLSEGSRGNLQQESLDFGGSNDGTRERDRGTQSQRSNGMAGTGEQHQVEGERDSAGRNNEPVKEPALKDVKPAEPPLEEAVRPPAVSAAKQIFQKNIAAIRLLKDLENQEREASVKEHEILKGFAGFGGIPDAFDSMKTNWAEEYKELKEVLTDEEYTAARASVLNAHFTPDAVIRQIYHGLNAMGFQHGSILEPSMGIGGFFGNMPEKMQQDSYLHGVELDPLTGRIAKKLYPDAVISIQGFETTTYENNAFDVAVGNVPFGNYKLSDSNYAKENFLIHDYFLAKMIDQVRPGGLVAAITSHGTMDKTDARAREYLARRGELVRAIRLPNTAFKAAGTAVTADILIFKKREQILAEDAELPNWVHSESFQGEEDVSVNPYFLEHPEDVMGTLEKQSTAYGYDVTCRPNPESSLEAQLFAAMERFTPMYTAISGERKIPKQIRNSAEARPYSFFINAENKLFYQGDALPEQVKEISGKAEEKVRQVIELRESVRAVIELQKMGAADDALLPAQDKMNRIYDAYVERFGRIKEDKELKKLFDKDSSYPLLCTLEVYEKNQFKEKCSIFRTRTINPQIVPDHADNALDALKISMTEKGRVDLPYMARLLGERTVPKSLIDELNYRHIYYDFAFEEYQFAEQYLSGDIREKIDMLETFIQERVEENEKIVQDDMLPWSDEVPEYIPQNEEERAIVEKDPWDYVSSPDGMAYLEEHKDNRELFLHIARAYPNTADMLKLAGYDEDPLFSLECYKRGKALSSLGMKGNHLLKQVLREIGESRSLYSRFDRDDAVLYQFLTEKFTEYQSDPDALSGDLASEWEDYQKTVETQLSDALIKPTLPAVQKNNEEIEAMRRNVAALKNVVPKDLLPSEIQVDLGAQWIPVDDVRDFLIETFEPSYYERGKIKVNFAKITGNWSIEGKGAGNGNAKAENTYGTKDLNAYELVEHTLNLREAKVMMKVYVDGVEKSVVNQQATILAQQKQELIKNEFSKWLWKDPSRRNRLTAYYNRHFNNIRPCEYNGDDLTFPGMNSEINLRKHQKDAIAHTLFGGNTLLAHSVGAGKTYEMVASIMESKRLGLASKALVVVPKHLTEQFGHEFLQLYPAAKVLVATKKDFEKENRKEFCAKIATQNWDAVVMGPTQFERIPISPKRLTVMLETEIQEITDGIEAANVERTGNRFTIKQMEQVKKKLQTQLGKIKETQTDSTVYFEDLGIDRLYVDEAHYYKNLFMYTKLSNVPGISTTGAVKSTDLYEKCRYLNEKNGEKGIVFATGTAISNSMTELYTMQRYLQPKRLAAEGLNSFDAWASTFGKTVTAVELNPEGKGFRSKTRFAKFMNLPELMSMFKEIADIKTADMLNLPVPEAEFIISRIPASDAQKKMVDQLAEGAAAIHNGNVNPSDDNMLKITGEGRMLALDQRLMDPNLPDDPNSKVNQCVKNVLDIYQETKAQRSAQMIFCDHSTPNKNKFNVYDDIKQKLIQQGVPEQEIAFIQDATTEKQKDEMFAKVRTGEIRVILGSTQMMGTGTNVQDKLIALHDLDVPWRPADLEQRSGRIIRQGNENKKVKVFRYVTEGTFDAYLWQIIENKQRFISQVLTSNTPARTADDVDEATLSYAEIKAIATGNPLIKEKMDLDIQLEKLKLARSAHLTNQHNLERQINEIMPNEILDKEQYLDRLQKDQEYLKAHTVLTDDVKHFEIKLNGKVFKDEKEAAEVLTKIAKDGKIQQLRGEYLGMKLQGTYDALYDSYNIALIHMNHYAAAASLLGETTLQQIKGIKKNIQQYCKYTERSISEAKEKLDVAKRSLNDPFPMEEEYQTKLLRLKEIEAQLNLDGPAFDKNSEQENRLAALVNNHSGEENATVSAFFTIAKDILKDPAAKWKSIDDTLAASRLLLAGCPKEEVVNALYQYSPSVTEKKSLEKLVHKTEKNLAAASAAAR